jgi:hypothetical protein
MTRAKVTIRPDAAGGTTVILEWIAIDDAERPGAIEFTEEFRFDAGSAAAYVSRVALDEGHIRSGTFWIDPQGLRHFTMEAEAGNICMTGREV